MARIKIGRDFRLQLQEEARNQGRRANGAFVEDSAQGGRMQRFREEALALDEGNFRIPGKSPQVLLEDCSFHDLAAETIVDNKGNPVGRAFIFEHFGPGEHCRDAWNRLNSRTRLQEAGETGAVDMSMFSGIMGQLLINSTLAGFQHEEFTFSGMAGVYNTNITTGERLPGVSLPHTGDITGDEDLMLITPQKQFPYLTMGENYTELPPTEQRGGIMGLHRLAIYNDNTGLIAKNAAEGSKLLGIRKEQRGLQCLARGRNGHVAFPYKEKYLYDSVPLQLDIYQATAGASNGQLAHNLDQAGVSCAGRPFPWINDIPANEMVNYQAFRTADRALAKLVDPNNGLPIAMNMPTVFAPQTARFNIAHVMEAFQTWRTSGATSGMADDGGVMTVGPNLAKTLLNIQVQTSKMLRQEMVKSGLYGDAVAVNSVLADPVWWMGDFKEAIKYITNWNIKVIMAPANSDAEFNQDIVMRWRFDEMGQWAWFQPRLVQRHNFLSQANTLG